MLTQLGHLFDETPAQLRSACKRAAAAEAAAVPAQPAAAPASDAADIVADSSAAKDPPAEQPAAAAATKAVDSSSDGQRSAITEGQVTAEPRLASELNVVREGSMELDYGTDDGEGAHKCAGTLTRPSLLHQCKSIFAVPISRVQLSALPEACNAPI